MPPFIATFLVTWFVFIVQFFWLYIDDLVGKGLDNSIILKLILFLAPTIVPAALPLGTLLAAIMTYGNLSESSELTAVRSAGISLWRFSKPLIALVSVITVAAFAFNNYVIPVANLNFYTLLMDVRNTKPAVNIKAGIFYNDIPGYSIYVENKKSNNRTVGNMLIYDHSAGKSNDRLITAKEAEMYVTEDKRYLVFEMRNGCRYEEKIGKTAKDLEHVKLEFKYWKKIFDLSSFEMKKTDNDYLKSNEIMLTNAKLTSRIDSSKKRALEVTNSNIQSLRPYNALFAYDTTAQAYIREIRANSANINNSNQESLLNLMPDTLRQLIKQNAASSFQSIKGVLNVFKNDDDIHKSVICKLKIEWHKKISLAASCLILFLIGAPLGALIRKGGFGLPFVVAVTFFVVYRFMTVFSEKLATQGNISAFWGMWLPPLCLLLIALVLFYNANRDKRIISAGVIYFINNNLIQPIKRLFVPKTQLNK